MSIVYTTYGLQIRVNCPIPGLLASRATPTPDVDIWLGVLHPSLDASSRGDMSVWYASSEMDECGTPLLTVKQTVGGDYYLFLYLDGTEFVVDRLGTQIWAAWPPTSTLEDTLTYLLGPILGFVLCLRGIPCLHASAVSLGEQAVALVGPAGAGKSTTAAAFAKQGYAVLSDDIVTLRRRGDTIVVQPAATHLRLWPQSSDILFGSSEALPRLTPTWEKRYLDLTQNGYKFQEQPLPLGAVYLLDQRRTDSAPPSVGPVTARDGFMALVANTYANTLLDSAMRAREFDSLRHLMASIPLRRVTPNADPAHLPRLCDVIVEDFQRLLDALAPVGS